MQLTLPVRSYIAAVVVLGLVSLVYFCSRAPWSLALVPTFLAVMAGVAVLDVYASVIPEFRSQVSASVALHVAGILVLGPGLGVAAGTAGTLVSEGFLRFSKLRWGDLGGYVQIIGFNTAQIATSLGLVGLFLMWVSPPDMAINNPASFAKVVGAFALYVVINDSLVSGIVALQTRQSFRQLAAEWFSEFTTQYLVLGLSTVLLVALYSISPVHSLLGFTPLVLVHFSFRSYLRLREESQKTFEKVVDIIEQRDPYTGVHSAEVAALAAAVAQEMQLKPSEIEAVRSVARVHDIGKIAVPDSILLKPGKLDPDEWEVMKRHTEIGADLLKGLAIYDEYAQAVRHEHEHWNGSGYPDGLKGDLIPLSARIIAAADVYHALISDRPYRPAHTKEEALDIIRTSSGRHLDPKVVGALLRVLERMNGEQSEESSA